MPIHPEQLPRLVALPSRGLDRRSVGDLARSAAARGGQRPFVTFYHDATGERTELGHATLENWVSKAANLLTDELDLGPGTSLHVRLGTHWTALVVLLAAWRCGSQVRWGGTPGTADATVVTEDLLDEATDPQRTLVVGSGLAGRLTSDAPGGLRFTEEVLACPDEFDDPEVSPGAVALEAGDGARGERTDVTHSDLLALAAATVEALGLGGGERLLLLHPLESLEAVATVLAALEAGASIVMVASPRPAAVPERATAERCDLVLAPAGSGQGGDVPALTLRVERAADGTLSGVRVMPARP